MLFWLSKLILAFILYRFVREKMDIRHSTPEESYGPRTEVIRSGKRIFNRFLFDLIFMSLDIGANLGSKAIE